MPKDGLFKEGMSVEPSEREQALLAAFANKASPAQLEELLVAEETWPDALLPYGLGIFEESYFVAAVQRLLGGDPNTAAYQENCLAAARDLAASYQRGIIYETEYPDSYGKSDATTLERQAAALLWYTRTASEIVAIMEKYQDRRQIIPVSHAFKQRLIREATTIRFEPPSEHHPENGALIVAAGLQDLELLQHVYARGCAECATGTVDNGAAPDFLGYFAVNAAVWAAIELNESILRELLGMGSMWQRHGLMQCNLLHWVCASAAVTYTENPGHQARCDKAKACVTMLRGLCPGIDEGANLFGLKPIDYAPEWLYQSLRSELTHVFACKQ